MNPVGTRSLSRGWSLTTFSGSFSHSSCSGYPPDEESTQDWGLGRGATPVKPSEALALLQGEGWEGHILWRHPRGESYVTSQATDAAQLRCFSERWMRTYDIATMRQLLAEAGPGTFQVDGFIVLLRTDVKIERGEVTMDWQDRGPSELA